MNDYYKQFNVEYLKNVEFVENGYAKTQMRDDCIKYIQYLQSQLSQKENKLNEAIEYIYKNSIPIALTVNPPIHKLDFEGDINEVLEILKKVED